MNFIAAAGKTRFNNIIDILFTSQIISTAKPIIKKKCQFFQKRISNFYHAKNIGPLILGLILTFLTTSLNAADQLPSIYKVAFDVGGHFYDYQNYQGVPYFHGGLDLCAPAGTEVFTPVSGKVSVSDYKINASAKPHQFVYERKTFRKGEVSSTRYLEVAIKTEAGQTWMFRHIEPYSVPDDLFEAAKNGKTIAAGSKIGKVSPWILPVLPEKRIYDHIHLEILDSDGSFLNPAHLVKITKDYYPPVIQSIYAARHGSEEAQILDSNNKTLSGKIDLIFGVNDRMNQAAYQHSIYQVVWNLEKFIPGSSEKETLVNSRETFRFDRLPIKGDRTQLSTVIYRDSVRVGSTRIQANGNHGPRFFLVNLTCGTTSSDYSAEKCLDTTEFPNGRYLLTISAFDGAGNNRRKTVEFNIRN